MKISNKKILITGGLGFIGLNLLKKLDSVSNDIIILDKYSNKKTTLPDNLTLINDDINKISNYKNELEYTDLVIHLASGSIPKIINNDPIKDIEDEMIKNLKFFDFLSENNIKRIIFPSSGGTVYGEMTDKLNSLSKNTLPISFYGAHKLLIENYLRIYFHEKKLIPIILRISNPYGPNQSNYKKQGFIGTAIKSIIEHNEIDVWGDGSVVRDYIHIDDLSELLLKCLDVNESCMFNVGSGIGLSIIDILEEIKFIHKKEFKINYLESSDYDVKKSILDISNTKKFFDWQPKVSIEDGIKQLYLSIKEQIQIEVKK